MNRKIIDRTTELFVLICLAAAIAILTLSARTGPAAGSLAALTVQTVGEQDMEKFRSLLREARQLVDTNLDPDPVLGDLERLFPGRHETWALAGRYAESMGLDSEALAAYARAVRLQPDYLDEGSGLFLGRRIEALTDRVMDDLVRVRKAGGLDAAGKEMLKTAYFLRRRLAGGCE